MARQSKLCTDIRIKADFQTEVAILKFQKEHQSKLGLRKYSKPEAAADFLGDLLKKIPLEKICVPEFLPTKVVSDAKFKKPVEIRMCVENEINGAIIKFQADVVSKRGKKDYSKPEATIDLYRELLKRV